MDNVQKQQAIDRIKQANNILVTVSNNPTIDQLATCIGLTLALNKLDKHATAVFSGVVPDIIEFLQPEKTIESNTDSLRDFIIALDKSKADKLRYKVEDKVVKIFITPYKTSIGQEDLVFSQGDFNVDVVLALGVHTQAELDQTITSHGRILHDAAIISVNTKAGPGIGTINWLDTRASSLAELAVELLAGLDKSLIDAQMATAFLAGIVSETQRFSNARTSPRTMSISAELMAAGANQQLVATKLEEKPKIPVAPPPTPAAQTPQPMPEASKPAPQLQGKASEPKKEEGTLEINHGPKPLNSLSDLSEENEAAGGGEDLPDEPPTPQIDIDREGILRRVEDIERAEAQQSGKPETAPSHVEGTERIMLEPPTLGGQANAVATPGGGAFMSADPLTLPTPQTGPMLSRDAPFPADSDLERPSNAPQDLSTAASSSMLSHETPVAPPPDPNGSSLPPVVGPLPSVAQPAATPMPDLDAARQAVNQATPSDRPLEPVAALNAQPVHLDLGNSSPSAAPPSAPNESERHGMKIIQPIPHAPDVSLPPLDPSAPPPSPPPIMPTPQ